MQEKIEEPTDAAKLEISPESRILQRCPVCAARDWRRTSRAMRFTSSDWFECSHCGFVARTDVLAGETIHRLLADRMAVAAFAPEPDDPFFVEAYALRTLAFSRRRWAEPKGADQRDALRHPYVDLPARAWLESLDTAPAVPVSLAILCRGREVEAAASLAAEYAGAFDDILLMVDTDPSIPGAQVAESGPRIVYRSLARDFAEQRNAAQDAAHHDWVLQLDADEHLCVQTLRDMAHVAGIAERDGALSVGLRRRNLVDGVVSDLFPDIQYRLNRKSVRYRGRVHERPELPRNWRDSFIAPNLVIDHHLARNHVEARSVAYEELSPGNGRLFERDALLSPYRP